MIGFGPTVFCRFLAIALVALGQLPSQTALALSCNEQTFESREAQELFGHANLVFTGTLKRIDTIPSSPAPYGVVQGAGVFVSDYLYKGELDSSARIAIDATTKIGERYIVFASSNHEGLHAFSPCLQVVIRPSVKSKGYLDFLNALPAPGSGGDVWIYFPDLPEGFHSKLGALEFEGIKVKFSVIPNIGGRVSAEHIPAGTYRLLTPPPDGFEFVCDSIGRCDDLEAFDRGLERWSFALKPVTNTVPVNR